MQPSSSLRECFETESYMHYPLACPIRWMPSVLMHHGDHDNRLPNRSQGYVRLSAVSHPRFGRWSEARLSYKDAGQGPSGFASVQYLETNCSRLIYPKWKLSPYSRRWVLPRHMSHSIVFPIPLPLPNTPALIPAVIFPVLWIHHTMASPTLKRSSPGISPFEPWSTVSSQLCKSPHSRR